MERAYERALDLLSSSWYNSRAPGVISQITIFIDISHETSVFRLQKDDELFQSLKQKRTERNGMVPAFINRVHYLACGVHDRGCCYSNT